MQTWNALNVTTLLKTNNCTNLFKIGVYSYNALSAHKRMSMWFQGMTEKTTYLVHFKNNVCTRVANCLCAHESVLFVFFPTCVAIRGMNTKITLEWAHEQFVTRVPTLFLSHIRHNESINGDKNGNLQTCSSCFTRSLYVLLMGSHSICRWRHNDQKIVTRTRDKWY